MRLHSLILSAALLASTFCPVTDAAYAQTVTINGQTYLSGRSIIVRDGHVIIDGRDATPVNTKEINISVQGNVETLQVDVAQKVAITGDAGKVETVSGPVQVSGEIKGSVQTVSGDVKAGGHINGSVRTVSGDVTHRN